MGKRITNQEGFLIKAESKHGNFYDYSKCEYKSSKEKVEIVCPIHGSFWQTPSNHLHGFGCMGCCVDQRANRRRLSFSEFMEKATEVHGDRYDYSKVEYNNRDSKIIVKCPDHGEFQVRLAGHLKGVGCGFCDYLANKNNGAVNITTEQFIAKANVVHQNLYSYGKTEYNKTGNKVCITCDIHGDFWQLPNNHLRGMKCLRCVRELEYYRNTEETVLYLMRIQSELAEWDFLKLGISCDPRKRVRHLGLQLPTADIQILRWIESPSRPACEAESRIHNDKTLDHFWGAGDFGGYTECYWPKELPRLMQMLDEFVATTEGVQEICL
tara:strand:+ start:22671 stop:23645 length:975 start_codon:yes stop_codon:yes gene_type:complete